mmetsp:Transcript_32910/g.69380  ORF Transcript_32910/g.69380 Transcript_32910/m.69380 type:complete len:113 (-) Transcript_32910:11-349(-)
MQFQWKSLILFPLLLQVKGVASSQTNSKRALRRYREVGGPHRVVSGAATSRNRQNGTYELNGRKYFVKTKGISHNTRTKRKKNHKYTKKQILQTRTEDAAKKQMFKYQRRPN